MLVGLGGCVATQWIDGGSGSLPQEQEGVCGEYLEECLTSEIEMQADICSTDLTHALTSPLPTLEMMDLVREPCELKDVRCFRDIFCLDDFRDLVAAREDVAVDKTSSAALFQREVPDSSHNALTSPLPLFFNEYRLRSTIFWYRC